MTARKRGKGSWKPHAHFQWSACLCQCCQQSLQRAQHSCLTHLWHLLWVTFSLQKWIEEDCVYFSLSCCRPALRRAKKRDYLKEGSLDPKQNTQAPTKAAGALHKPFSYLSVFIQTCPAPPGTKLRFWQVLDVPSAFPQEQILPSYPGILADPSVCDHQDMKFHELSHWLYVQSEWSCNFGEVIQHFI